MSLSTLRPRAKSLIALVSAFRKPSSWVPPSWVLMLLAKLRTRSLYPVVHCMATSISASLVVSLKNATCLCTGSREEFRCLMKSMRPPRYWNRLLGDLVTALVAEPEHDAAVQERHLANAACDGRHLVGGGVGEDLRIRPERDLGAGPLRHFALLEVVLGLAVLEGLRPAETVPGHLNLETTGEGIDDRDPDTVQAAADRVRAGVELAACMERGQHRRSQQVSCSSSAYRRESRDRCP